MTHYEDEENDLGEYLTKPVADIHYINATGDSMQGDLNMGGKKITNLADPSDPKDAATKEFVEKYVDDETDVFLTKRNGVLESDLDCSGKRLKNVKNPENITDAINKNYVHSNFISKQNGELSSDLDCKNKRLKNVAIPTDNKDAVSKEYVSANCLNGVFNHNVRGGDEGFRWDARVKRIAGVADPIDHNDAAHKSYVDNKVRDSLNNISLPSSSTSAVSKLWVENFTSRTFESIGLAKIIPFYTSVDLPISRNKVGFTATIPVLESIQQVDPKNCMADYSIHPSAREEKIDSRTRIKNLELEHRNKTLNGITIQSCTIRSYRSSAATETNPLFSLDVFFRMTAEKDRPPTFYIQGTLKIFNEEITLQTANVMQHNQATRSETENN